MRHPFVIGTLALLLSGACSQASSDSGDLLDDGGPADGAAVDRGNDAGGTAKDDGAAGADGTAGPDSAADASCGACVSDPASLVNTLVGTTGGGNTFPGADVPFGMIQWSPDTSPDRSLGGGYEYGDTRLIGFSLTHISGPGCGAYGDVPILPMVGGLPSGDPSAHVEPFAHTGELGTAGYYTVQSGTSPNTITTELTATLHSAMARFTYPPTTSASILIKLLDSQNGATGSTATVVSDHEVQGSATVSSNFCGYQTPYTVYFDLVFDQAFANPETIDSDGGIPDVIFLTFDTTTTQVVQAKVAISWVSVANAVANLSSENPSWGFDSVESAAHSAWNDLLDRIQVAGGTPDEQRLFYTSLYHSLLHPNVFSDVNGQYLGFDMKTHAVSGAQRAQYTNYSGWDIYRGQAQLSALMAPQQMSDSAQSMINDAAQSNGQLPKWVLANAETYVMVGDPSDGIISAYDAFGATNFDTASALQYMLAEADNPNNIRPGLSYYLDRGYLPDDGNYGCCNYYGSVSTLLEYTQADFALSQFASELGDNADSARLLARAQNWKNVFDPATGLFTPKLLDGTFVSGFTATGTQGMVEGSAAQYQFEQPFDRQALLTAMGGASAVNPILANYFTQLDDCDFNAPYACFTNEMDLGQQYENSYAGEPWAAQSVVNALRTQVFQDAPMLINNNDDLGAESSVLAWSMLGVYPAYPGSAVLLLNAPVFPEELIHLPSGATLIINAPDASATAPYVQALQVNGQTASKAWLDASFVRKGGTLTFALGSTPNTSWGTAAADAPPSYGAGDTAAIGFIESSPVVVNPGAQTAVTFGAQSTRSDVSQTIRWQAATDAGVSITPSNGTLSLGVGARATQALMVSGPVAYGNYIVPIQMISSQDAAVPAFTIPVVVAPAGSILPYVNNVGISDDGTGTGNFDNGGHSYSAQALATAGATPGSTLTVAGINFAWPNVPAGSPDNIQVGGQTIAFNETSVKTTIHILGSAANGDAQGTVTVTFADGTTQGVPVVFTDWTEGGGSGSTAAGNAVALTMAYRENGTSRDNTTSYVFTFSATLTDTASPVVSVTLPSTSSGGTMHVFDIELD